MVSESTPPICKQIASEPDSEEFGKVLLKKLRMLRAQEYTQKVENDESIKGMILRKVYPSHTDAKPTTVLHPDFEIIIKSAERTEVDLKGSCRFEGNFANMG